MNKNSYEDMISINQLEELIQRDINDTHSYPFMIIANSGRVQLFNQIQQCHVS